MFTWYELRTVDLDAAQAFYFHVMGWQARRSESGAFFHVGGERQIGLTVLPEQAQRRGAPSHFLGHVFVPDVTAWAQRFIAAGGELLGGVQRSTAGELAVIRDPLDAVLGLSSRVDGPSRAVTWHELHSKDAAQAWSIYSGLFPWHSAGLFELGHDLGSYRTFSWNGALHTVGGMANTARAPHIHTHWLFHFAVDRIEEILDRVRERGGSVAAGPLALPGGARFAVCEDSQGSAFAVRERVVAQSL